MKLKLSKFVIGKLQKDLLSAIDDDTDMEERDANFFVVSTGKKHVNMWLHIPIQALPWVAVILLGLIFAALKLDPATLKFIYHLLPGT